MISDRDPITWKVEAPRCVAKTMVTRTSNISAKTMTKPAQNVKTAVVKK